jgi:hypothetical protein
MHSDFQRFVSVASWATAFTAIIWVRIPSGTPIESIIYEFGVRCLGLRYTNNLDGTKDRAGQEQRGFRRFSLRGLDKVSSE